MRWLLFFIVLALSGASCALGFWLSKKGQRAAAITIAVGLVFVLLRAVVRWSPAFEYDLLPYDLYAIIHPWWAFPFAFVILGAGAPHMSTLNARRGVWVFTFLLGLVGLSRLWITARFDPTTVHGVLDRHGVCIQSTDYSCGAASAVMLLDRHGVRTVEREMAELCWTNGLTGTDEFGVCMGLRQKLA